MARVQAVVERGGAKKADAGKPPKVDRRARVDSFLRESDKFLKACVTATRGGKPKEARYFRKRAHDAARMAARLIGVLEIEFGVPMASEIIRARNMFLAIADQRKDQS